MPEARPAEAPVVGRPPRRARLAVVVGSGGVKCAAAVGMWKVLQCERIGLAPVEAGTT